ncbi:MAG: aspartate--tRNA ligase, partial [Anaerotignaceae bacterium]
MGELMTGLKRSHMCCYVNEQLIGEEVTVMGWVQKRRDLGKLIFIALRDRTGIVQAVVDGNSEEEIFKKAETIRSEFVVAIKGTVCARTEENINPAMETGKIEIIAHEVRILSESETPPFHIEENSQVKDDLRLKYRYIDLRRPDIHRNLKLRHDVTLITREFLNDEGFMEIETPILGKSTPEGARDYLVPSRVHPGNFYGLPQSPQLYKQLLMVSGMDRYYQIAKCFRDEDLRADRQPEFTQIDMELSFVDVEDILDVNERLIKEVFKKALNVEVETPFDRLTYKEAMDRFGSDKPDTRFGMELKDISEVVNGTDFVVFKGALENGGTVRAINAKGCGNFPRKQIDSLVEFVKTYRAKGLAWIVVNEDGTIKSQIAKFFTEEKMAEIVSAMEGEAGDLILICADTNKVVFDALGALRVEISKRLNLTKQDDYKFLWVTEFPMLEWDEEGNRFVAVHHPFTAPMDEDLPLIDTDPAKVRAKAYD